MWRSRVAVVMVWPFPRRSRPEEPAAPVLAEADRAVLAAVEDWLGGRSADLNAQVADAALEVRRAGAGLVLVARSRGGKLVRLEVHDASMRPLVDRLVRDFEAKGMWSFNGVVRTLDAST